jgi:membrane associated rhomboid family serine protease
VLRGATVFIPISDSPNPRGLPWMTVALVAANVAVYLLFTLPLSAARPDPADPLVREYLQAIAPALPPNVPVQAVLAQLTRYDLFVFDHGFRPAAPAVADLFTAMFLHAGLLHLVGNMLYLWVYGNNVEHRLGPVMFLVWYLATGAAATLFFMLFAANTQVPLVGASGAVSGVLGFYFLWFPGHTVRVFAFLFPFYVGSFFLNARIVLGLYLVVDNLLPFLIAPTGSPVAHGAHIGGFFAGVLVAWLMRGRTQPSQE